MAAVADAAAAAMMEAGRTAMNFIGGPIFLSFFRVVNTAYTETKRFKNLFRELQHTLGCLERIRPTIIERIRLHNLQLNMESSEIDELETRTAEGERLVGKLRNMRVWNYCCLSCYADQLDELKKDLKALFRLLTIEGIADQKESVVLLRENKRRVDRLERSVEAIDTKIDRVLENLGSTPGSSKTAETVPNGNEQVIPSEAGAALGAAFQKLFDVVVQVKDKRKMFRPFLEDLIFVLGTLQPLIKEIELLDCPREELEYFAKQMEEGTKLVTKCSKVRLCANFQKHHYTNRLLALDESLQEQLYILRGQVTRKVKEMVDSTRNIEKVVEKIEGKTDMLHNQAELRVSGEVPEIKATDQATEPPYPAVELEVPEMRETMDPTKETLISKRNIEEDVKQTEGSTSKVQDKVETPFSRFGLEVQKVQRTMDLKNQESRMFGVGELVGGADVGTLLAMLYEVVKDAEDKSTMFKSLILDILSRLDSLKPVMEGIDNNDRLFNLQKEEMQKIRELMWNGKELFLKCSKISPRQSYKTYIFANKLLELERSLNRLFDILSVRGRDKLSMQRTIKTEVELLPVAAVLCEVIKDVEDKTIKFVPILGRIISSIGAVKPLMEDNEKYKWLLDHPKEELQDFRKQMKNGLKLIPKCSKVGLSEFERRKKYMYTYTLLGVEKALKRLFAILSVQDTRDAKAALIEQGTIINEISQLRVSDASLEEEEPEPSPILVGLDVPLRELKKKLFEDDVSMLVLTAPGGSGKTTLAKKLCEEVKDAFKNNILFVTVSNKPNLEHIVKEICQQKDVQVPAFLNELTAEKRLQHYLKEGQKTLLVLDDVWSGPLSESFLEKIDQFKMSNLKILVTSRFELPRFGCAFHLQPLSDADAMKLFHHSASLGDKNCQIPENLSRKIVEQCKGFPLAITVVGRSILGQPTEIWHKRVMEWSNDPYMLDDETVVIDCLQRSLDAMEEKEPFIKECFLDLACFPEDQKIPAAALIDMWAELYDLDEDYLSIRILNELTACSLANLVVARDEKRLMVDDNYREHFVTQHEMLRELAIYNTKQGPVEHRKRLILDIRGERQPKWLTEQKYQPIKARLLSIFSDGAFSKYWQNIQVPEVEVLFLNFQTKNYSLPEFAEKCDKLKVLIVTNYGLLPAELSNFHLLGSLSNLKRIRLERISFPSLTNHSVELKRLKMISFYMCNVGEAFSSSSFRIADAFPSLEELNIDYCNDLVELPSTTCYLIHLKKLNITNCHKLSALPKEIGKLPNLIELTLSNCTGLVELPESINRLGKILDTSDCSSLQ